MCQLSAPTIEGGVGAFDNNAFWGVWGVYPPLKEQRAQPFALRHLFFLPCANSIDFLLVSYRLSINFL